MAFSGAVATIPGVEGRGLTRKSEGFWGAADTAGTAGTGMPLLLRLQDQARKVFEAAVIRAFSIRRETAGG